MDDRPIDTAADDRSSRSLDRHTVEGFGDEWTTYDQGDRDPESIRRSFDRYVAEFPWPPEGSIGIDVGAGSGRWAAQVIGRGRRVVALDASASALAVCRRNAPGAPAVNGSAVELPFADDSFDFAISLGVLHHLPDTEGAIREIHRVLRPGAPFLVYLYYAFDNRPQWFRSLWQVSDVLRRALAEAPFKVRLAVTRVIAYTVYWPLSRLARVAERIGLGVDSFPLSGYRHQPVYVLRTDALDRFGTRLEKRYSRAEIEELLVAQGFSDIRFNPEFPFWCAVGRA